MFVVENSRFFFSRSKYKNTTMIGAIASAHMARTRLLAEQRERRRRRARRENQARLRERQRAQSESRRRFHEHEQRLNAR